MATIVNTSTPADTGSSGSGFLVGIILLILAVVLFLMIGLPYLRGVVSSGTPQVNVPGKIDVNVNQPGK